MTKVLTTDCSASLENSLNLRIKLYKHIFLQSNFFVPRLYF